ncbi:MAG: hypothetical protein JHC40_05620, partial [Burkholderiales bacterium]|nr:hypothetical protein [Burkholderiales bacterium]
MYKTLLSAAVVAAFAASTASAAIPKTFYFGAPAVTIAKHGADDPAGDDRGKHGAGHAKNGADDPPGDNRGKDGAGHAKNGADDPAGDN